jgi:hypothetical protein
VLITKISSKQNVALPAHSGRICCRWTNQAGSDWTMVIAFHWWAVRKMFRFLPLIWWTLKQIIVIVVVYFFLLAMLMLMLSFSITLYVLYALQVQMFILGLPIFSHHFSVLHVLKLAFCDHLPYVWYLLLGCLMEANTPVELERMHSSESVNRCYKFKYELHFDCLLEIVNVLWN